MCGDCVRGPCPYVPRLFLLGLHHGYLQHHRSWKTALIVAAVVPGLCTCHCLLSLFRLLGESIVSSFPSDKNSTI